MSRSQPTRRPAPSALLLPPLLALTLGVASASPSDDCSALSFFSPLPGRVDRVDVATSESAERVALVWGTMTEYGKRVVYAQTTDLHGFPMSPVEFLGEGTPSGWTAGPVVADVADGSLFVVAWLDEYGSELELAALDAASGKPVARETVTLSTPGFADVEIGGSTAGGEALVIVRTMAELHSLLVRPMPWAEGHFEVGEEETVVGEGEFAIWSMSVSRGPSWLVAYWRRQDVFNDVFGCTVGPTGAPVSEPQVILQTANRNIGYMNPSVAGEGPEKVVVVEYDQSGGGSVSAIRAARLDTGSCLPESFCTPTGWVEVASVTGPADYVTRPAVGLSGDHLVVSWRAYDSTGVYPVLTVGLDAATLAPCAPATQVGSSEELTLAPVTTVVGAGTPAMAVWWGSSCYTAEIHARARAFEVCP